MTTEANTTDQIRQFLYETFPASQKAGLRDDESLLDTGIVDSLGILEIVTFLETRFGAVLRDDDILVENFQSISAIARLAEERSAATRPVPSAAE